MAWLEKNKIPKISKFLKTYVMKNQTKLKNTKLPINCESPKNLKKIQSTKNTNFQNLEIFWNGKNAGTKKSCNPEIFLDHEISRDSEKTQKNETVLYSRFLKFWKTRKIINSP